MRENGLEEPHPSRFGPDHPGYEEAMSAHRLALAEGDMGYMDRRSGLFVMTASYLAERPCCDRGCRHCPWVGAATEC